jgi:hypothetical protein
MTKVVTIGTALLALLLAACGGGSEGYSEAPETAVAAHTAAPTATAAPAKAAKTAKNRPDADGDGIPDAVTLKGRLGDTLTLEGAGLNDNHTKSRIRVTLQGMKGPFPGFKVASNRQIIGVTLKVKNVGKLKYDDPLPSGQLTGASGESGKQTSLIPFGTTNPCDNPSLKLKSGQSKTVCIAFEVPKKDKPRTFEFGTDSGFGDTGLWKLK